MVLVLRSKEHSVHFVEDQKENEVWWIQYKINDAHRHEACPQIQ